LRLVLGRIEARTTSLPAAACKERTTELFLRAGVGLFRSDLEEIRFVVRGRLGGEFSAGGGDFIDRDGIRFVVPGAADVGHDAGKLFVAEDGCPGSHLVGAVGGAFDLNGAGQAMEDDGCEPFLGAEDPFGTAQRRIFSGLPHAGGLVTAGAITAVDFFALKEGIIGDGGGLLIFECGEGRTGALIVEAASESSESGKGTARHEKGETANDEYRSYPHLLDALKGKGKQGRGGDAYPDFLVVSIDGMRPLIVGETKADETHINKAADEAAEIYGEAFFERGMPVLAAGIAGNDRSNIAVVVKKRGKRDWKPIEYRDNPIQWLPTPSETDLLLSDDQLFELDPRVPSQEILAKHGEEINRIFRQCKIKDEFRPAVIGAFMLALWQSKGRIRMDAEHILEDINNECRKAFKKADKNRLAESILVPEANDKLASEAPRIVYLLRLLNITTLTAEHDYLGQLYESFFRFTGGNTIGQYFTPRHITKFMTDVIAVGHSDFVIDPACGTGGFLVSSLYRMIGNRHPTHSQIAKHVSQHLRGFESEPITAALCVANMILRGDGNTGIVNGDCFTDKAFPYGKATVALGNPPFPHKQTDDPSEKFVNRALEALQTRGQLAFIVPASLLVKSEKKEWREKILGENSLKGVITLPDELFQPYAATTTAIVIIEKGVPHRNNTTTFFCRITNDGYRIRKNVRVEQPGEELSKAVHAFHEGLSIPGFCNREHCGSEEWSPGEFIKAAMPTKTELRAQVDLLFRNQTAFCSLHAHELIEFRKWLQAGKLKATPYQSLTFRESVIADSNTRSIGDKFDIFYGQRDLHSKENLVEGKSLIISSSGTDNGCYGFFNYESLIQPPFVTVQSTGSIGEAFVQTWPCGVTDDCLLLIPKKNATVEELYLVAAILRLEKWRFNYGRKITPKRISQFLLPNDKNLSAWIRERIVVTARIQEEILASHYQDDFRVKFQELAQQWKTGRTPSSVINRMAMHPAYQQIIGMGKKAVPLIFAEMNREIDHWFWALNAIEGIDPVPKESRGNVKEMALAWFQWGRQQGYKW